MYEVAPVVMAVWLGIVIKRYAPHRFRFLAAGAAVAMSGGIATLLNGELRQSPVYLLFDVGEAALGLTLGLAIAQCFAPLLRMVRGFASA
jgi:cytochrome c biogenesis protein CcdA